MNDVEMFRVECPDCKALLKADSTMIGRRARCRKCNGQVDVVAPKKNDEHAHKGWPATQQQKEHATKLGISFPPNVTRSELSVLIDAVLAKQFGDLFKHAE